MRIGLSLSFCVKDILQGKVDLKDVTKIYTSTHVTTPEDWKRLEELYCDVYWRANPTAALWILGYLRATGRIVQPKMEGRQAALYGPHEEGFHWWTSSEDAITWLDERTGKRLSGPNPGAEVLNQ